MTNRTAPVAFSRSVASQRCPSRPTWARVAPTYSRTKCEAPEPEAGAAQGAAQKLRHGASGTLHESGERSPALLNRFVAMGRRLYQHKPCSQERPPPGCSRWLGRPLSSRDKVSAARAVPVTQPRAVLEVRAPLPDPQARVLRRLPMPLARCGLGPKIRCWEASRGFQEVGQLPHKPWAPPAREHTTFREIEIFITTTSPSHPCSAAPGPELTGCVPRAGAQRLARSQRGRRRRLV